MNRWTNLTAPWGDKPKTRNRAEGFDLYPGLLVLGGLGLGAGLMYMLDPNRGRRRRALVRDRLVHTAHAMRDATGTTSRDLGHRARGLWAEGSHLLKHDGASDEVLAARVRSRLGRAVSHPHAIQVTAGNGRVSLSGQVLADEVDDLLSCVSKVRGVQEVENLLAIHAEAGDVLGLQGGRTRPNGNSPFMPANWSPTARLLAGVTGGALTAWCLKRRDSVGMAFGALGCGLLVRGLTNLEMKSLVGVGRDCRAVEVQKTINIKAPVGQVFDFWADYRNFPRFMSNVREVRPTGGDRSHWTVVGPAGVSVGWTAEVTEFARNKLMAWRTVPGSAIGSHGTVHFEPNPGGGTRVHIKLCYQPPGGAVGHALAGLFGADPKSEMDADLARMKTLIETGQMPRDAASPPASGREVALTRAGMSG